MTARKRRGRPPSVWHGQLGKKFVGAVAVAWWERRLRSKAQAIRIVLDQPDFVWLRKYLKTRNYKTEAEAIRYLEKQYLDAAEYWRGLPTYKEVIGKGRRIYWNTK